MLKRSGPSLEHPEVHRKVSQKTHCKKNIFCFFVFFGASNKNGVVTRNVD